MINLTKECSRTQWDVIKRTCSNFRTYPELKNRCMATPERFCRHFEKEEKFCRQAVASLVFTSISFPLRAAPNENEGKYFHVSDFTYRYIHSTLDGQIFQGPVVQSIVSLTSSLRVISLTVLADSIYNILIFFAEKR